MFTHKRTSMRRRVAVVIGTAAALSVLSAAPAVAGQTWSCPDGSGSTTDGWEIG